MKEILIENNEKSIEENQKALYEKPEIVELGTVSDLTQETLSVNIY